MRPRHTTRNAGPNDDAQIAELVQVYRDVEALFDGASCPGSTECCRFGITGREPYVTSIELALVKRAIAARGGSRSWKKAPEVRRDPEGRSTRQLSLPIVDEERTCPMLDAEGRCAVYAARPLGCRTFFCDRASLVGKVKQREINALVRRIQDIAAAHEPGGDKGRPLTRVLG